MFKTNYCILGPSWSFHFAERSNHWLRYIIEGIIEKLYRVLVDAGDMTSLQSSCGNSTTREVQDSTTRTGMTKLLTDAAVTNEVSIGLHPHDRALLCCATYIIVITLFLYSCRQWCLVDFSGTAQNVRMVRALHNTSSCTIHRMVL